MGRAPHLTGERSSITANSIIAIKGKAIAIKGFHQVPPLNNRELFHRDRALCAFCGGVFAPPGSPATTSCRSRAAAATPG